MTLSVPHPPPVRKLSSRRSLLTLPCQITRWLLGLPTSCCVSLRSSGIGSHALPSYQHRCSPFNNAWARLTPSFFTILNQKKIRCFSGTAVYSATGLPQQFGLCWVSHIEISLYIQEWVLWLWRSATQLGTTKHIISILRLQVNPLIKGVLRTLVVPSGTIGSSWGYRCPTPLLLPSPVPGPPPFINVSMTGWLVAHSHSGSDLTVGGDSRTQLQQFLCAVPGDTMVANAQKLRRWSRTPAPEDLSRLLQFASQQIISIHLLPLLLLHPKSGVIPQTCPVEPIVHIPGIPTFTGANRFLMRPWAELMQWMFAQLLLCTYVVLRWGSSPCWLLWGGSQLCTVLVNL